MDIKPVIRNNKIIDLEVSGVRFPIKEDEGISLDKLPEITGALEVLDKYVDITKVGSSERVKDEWTENELADFMKDNTELQKAILEVLLKEKEISEKELIKKLSAELHRNVRGWDIGGAIAGIHNRAINTWGKEKLIEKEWKRVNGKWMRFYRITPKYVEVIKKILV